MNQGRGISQNISGGQVFGGIQAATGNNIQQVQNFQAPDSQEPTDVGMKIAEVLSQVELLLLAENLPELIKEEVSLYIKTATKAAQKQKPNTELIKLNLKELVSTLEETDRAVDITGGIFSKIAPLLSSLCGLLGITKSFFGL